MATILEEILEFRKQELMQGRNPVEIALSRPQRRRLKRWLKKTGMVLTSVNDSAERIMGMRVIPK